MTESRRRAGARAAIALAIAAAALALSPGQASAAARTYYVSPTGAGSACTQEAPCEIAFALGSATSGDTVLPAGDDGSYALTEHLNVPAGVTVRGEANQPRPVLNSTAAGYGVQLGAGARLSDLELHYTNGNVLADALIAAGTVERVLIDAPNNTACAPVSETTLLDSVCWGEYGLRTQDSPGSSWSLTLRNDTIVASQEALHLQAENASDLQMITVNTIVRGVSLDIGADRFGTGTVTATLDHSNYGSVNAGTGTSVSPEGSGTNQTSPPFFVDAGAGDFREAADSPTVDAGIDEAANGTTDLAGNPRALPGHLTCDQVPPAITDIGAFEFVPIAPPCPLPPPKPHAPNTRIAGATVRRHEATFRFRAVRETEGLSFQCELAEEPFRPCSSPETYKHLKPGRYRFTVRAVGRPGGIDLTPAVRSIQIGRHG